MPSQPAIFTVGPPPHRRSSSSIIQMNWAWFVALAPAAFLGAVAYGLSPEASQTLGPPIGFKAKFLETLLVQFGLTPAFLSAAGALGLLSFGVGFGMIAEYVIQVAFRQPYRATDGHGALMGLLIAMLMPPTVPWWVMMIGIAVAILVGKQIYGGLGFYPLHPAMIGWLILLLSWQHHIYPVGMRSIASMHWVVIAVTAMGGFSLIAMGYMGWRIPVAVLVGVAVSAAGFHYAYPALSEGPWWQGAGLELVTGHVMLAAFFIATDTTSSPSGSLAQVLFGLTVGALIMLIRVYGQWPDAVPFAVLLSNIVNPLLDRIPLPRVKEVVIQNG